MPTVAPTSKQRFWRVFITVAAVVAVAAVVPGLAHVEPASSPAIESDAPGVAAAAQQELPVALRIELLESAWAKHGVVVNDRAVLSRVRVYRYLDRLPEFESLLHVRVREALEYDTVYSGRWRSSRALIWGPEAARRLTDSTVVFTARVSYAAQGHSERYWMRATPGAARPWMVDSITIAGFYYY